ncbi:MAG: carboxylating nicotinate-nucleotide diphosphorylase [Bacteroidales bacterium]|jgi:nicotinate-nucleotide pyrophosphorylase (carboxylating)|nr:carboxylating nicotinate-nucleotide diphosphorylase [Bacteroidales bacterium]
MIDVAYLTAFIDNAFKEDIGDGDHTSFACIPSFRQGKAQLLVKQEGILAGVEVAERIFHRFDAELKVNVFLRDGAEVHPGDAAFTVEGKVISILQCERLVLNLMQHMSGIATQTRLYVKELEGTSARLLDTRKTTPGMRLLDKEAVRTGGGINHRIGLFDMILLKDNHIDFAGGIEKAIDRVHAYLQEHGKNLKIEIEARSLNDVERILRHNRIDRIMLDNFDTENTAKAVQMIDGKYETESSGNITLANIRSYALCGVDYISVGALTHHVCGLDMSLKAIK